ncbi:DUF1289 domain-containing protein [Pseudomonas matsuisoli]|uniref:DUF1289 domain-containing protein n=1 Tax=Pseudomonas matsuisoli TaxID=1515666 RepID=UPI00166B2A61|nr:DUF1289 domain-containing protein [Pseudomonas matsuisoli]
MTGLTEEERPVASPCVHICALEDDDTCSGCQRSITEITDWSRMTNAERRETLQRCHDRAVAKGLLIG